MSRRRTLILFLGMMLFLATSAESCTEDHHYAAPSGFCADIFGDGQNGRTAGLESIMWPGQVIDNYNSDNENIGLLPCQPRNYQVTMKPGEGGDRGTPTEATTNNNTNVLVAWTMYFTLNQDRVAQRDMADLCGKYQCWFNPDDVNDPKSANPHWRLMLDENPGRAGDDAIKAAINGFGADVKLGGESWNGFGDSIWRHPTTEQSLKIAQEADKLFDATARVRTGSNQDLFCGSGSVSFWKDPKRPGAKGNHFTCGQVRFVIDNIVNADPAQQKASQQQAAAVHSQNANESRQNAADKLYGKGQGGFWLGVEDTIDRCAQDNQKCTINLGNPPGH